ncbi:MAG: beta-N-acetylhexosaminidase [Acidobacteria bacterium]|nr:beta-N-acetylhexosaminidase [Acidobacteriota bacterium]
MKSISVPRHLHRQVGQLAMVGFDGPTVPTELKALAREFDIGGVVLLARNIEAPEQVAELVHDLQRLARETPLWVAVDQEGGRVTRLRRPFTEWPAMRALGRSGDDRLAEDFARALAVELRAVGISLDFAPVLDLDTNPHNPVIGDRALGERPDEVARLGAIIIRTLQAHGVAACGKHFPGHGDTSVDSHLDLPVIEHPPDRLRAVEVAPFRAAIAEKVASIMVAHVLVPSLDDQAPASLSRAVVHELLRGELGFDGLILTDDLGMRAVSDRHSTARAAVAAVAAGSDAVLVCDPSHDRHAGALEAIVRSVEAGVLPLRTVDDAIERHRTIKARFGPAEAQPPVADDGSRNAAIAEVLAAPVPLSREWRPPSSRTLRAVLGSDEHQAIASRLAEFAC